MIRRITLAVALLAATLGATGVHAQLFRAYLSSEGNDTNPCTLPLPCRLLPAALNAVAANGEIWMLDSANYNTATVNVDKSVNILAVPGAVGSVLAVGGPALALNGGIKVSLRNMVISPLPGAGGTDGVQVNGGADLQVEDCVIANHAGNGVNVMFGKALVTGTSLRNNGGWGVRVGSGSQGEISRSKLASNGSGALLVTVSGFATSRGLIGDSVVSGGAIGVRATQQGLDGVSYLDVVRTVIQSVAGAAVQADVGGNGDARVILNAATITGNGNAWVAAIGQVHSFGNNHFSGNGGSSGPLVTATFQ